MPDFRARRGKGPIFVVGSPRSGTSILTWCLGQHANILPQEESVWMGEFAIFVGVQYEIGCKRGERSQLAALGIDRDEFFSTFGDSINNLILRHRNHLEMNSRRNAEKNPLQIHPAFNVSRSNDDPKARWVDGTPEYSLYICGLKKLFPNAQFVHIVRDVKAAVDSLLNFRPDGHAAFAETEQQAYEYWLRTESACAQAERALGTKIVHRLRYDDLVQRPEWAIRDVLNFLDEPFMAECIEPLTNRINSSNVPTNFRTSNPHADSDLVNRALTLSEQLQQPRASQPPSSHAKHEFLEAFGRRVAYVSGTDTQYGLAATEISRLSAIILRLLKNLNWCGLILAAQLLLAAVVNLASIAYTLDLPVAIRWLWLAAILVSTIIYVVIRPTSLRNLAARIIRRLASK